MPLPLSHEGLQRLAAHSTPTVCNAIEEFAVRPRHHGFMGPEVRCIFPEFGRSMVGYAATLRITADEPRGPTRGPSRPAFWDYVLSVPAPRVVVVQDLDAAPLGAYWGEVQANVHRALGCVGTVTNGGVRDIDEVRALGFHCFASCLLVSHAYVRIVDFGGPVHVGGLDVCSGDLIHGDPHGVTSVPEAVAARIDEVVATVAQRERRIIDACQAEPFDLERLKALF